MSTSFESIPGVTISARRALSAAGFKDLESLAGTNYEEVAGLPGIGSRTLERLQAALVDKGMSFSGEIPETEQCTATWTTLDSAAPEATETSEFPRVLHPKPGQSSQSYPRSVVVGNLQQSDRPETLCSRVFDCWLWASSLSLCHG
nr:helix-hairpin-helix domain-containing protein [Corynebacterium glutamicum]